MDMSQMCAGADHYFRSSKPHSRKLCVVFTFIYWKFSDASIPHAWSEIGFLPVKMFPQLLLDNEESQYVEGTRTYVRFIKWVARYNNNITT